MAAEPITDETSVPPSEPSALARIWADMVAAGWHQAVLRYASHGLLLMVLVGAIWLRQMSFSFIDVLASKASLQAEGGVLPAPTPTALAADDGAGALAIPVPTAEATDSALVSRLADPHTLIPSRGRAEILTYTVQPGDTLFGIAERYGLKPETVLWGNYFTLKDDPHSLFPGQVLNILPVDGTYHLVTEGNTLDQVAKFYGVTAQAILDWTGNNLDPADPKLIPSSYLVVPGGQRELQTWVVPTIKRAERSTQANDFGQCPGGYSGAVGSGFFIWPADNHFLSGYDFTSIHHGLDIKARTGNPIYAVDNGVVVYAGPNGFGYGNLVVIDHGNGWQSVYAHLSQWNVECGQSVYMTNVIGLAGNTGNSSGAHLHFELRYNGSYVNPWTVLP